MRVFWELTTLSIQRQLAYRAAHLAGLVTNLFFGLLRAAILVALFGARQQVAGLTIPMVVTYTGLSQAAIGYLSIFRWAEVMNSVYSGDISSDLLKPMNYFHFWLASDLGRAGVSLFMRSLPILIIYAILFDIQIPHGYTQWFALILSIILSWLISFAWRFLVNLSSFWTPNAIGILRFTFGVSWVLSGFIMPLDFFPDWFVKLANFTPFPSMIYTFIEIYLGTITGTALLQALLIQGLWVLLLIVAGQIILKAGLRRLVIQGG
jgi:ABC-2 type transport system permease protein